MLKAIFTFLASALRSVAGVIGSIAMAPIRFVDRLLVGGPGASPQEISAPEVRPYDGDAEPADDFDSRQMFYLEIANKVMAWAGDSIVADAPAPLPAKLPRALREWLPGLTRAECIAIISADEIGVSSHLQQMFALPGVRTVQCLAPLVEWPAEPSFAFDEGSPSFISYAACGWPARSRALARASQS
jgi:hypothetical protein